MKRQASRKEKINGPGNIQYDSVSSWDDSVYSVNDINRGSALLDPVLSMNLRHARALGRLAARADNPACPYSDDSLVAAWRDGYSNGV